MDVEDNSIQNLGDYLLGLGIKRNHVKVLTKFFSSDGGGSGLFLSAEGEEQRGQEEEIRKKSALIRLAKFLLRIRGKSIADMIDQNFNRFYNRAADCSVDFPGEARLEALTKMLQKNFKNSIQHVRYLHGLLTDEEENLSRAENRNKYMLSKINRRASLVKTLKLAHANALKRRKPLEEIFFQ